MRLLPLSSVRHLTRHRAQLVLSVVGVALGVAVALAIDLATQSSREAFRLSAEAVSGRATHQVVNDFAPLDETLFTRIRLEAGLRASAPVVEGFASSPLLPGMALRVVGVDPFSEGPFRGFVAGDGGTADLPDLVASEGGGVLTERTAAAAGLALGASLPVRIEGRAVTLSVVGTLPAVRDGAAALDDVLLMDVAAAQDALGMVGRLTRIDLRVDDGPAGEARLAAVRSLLGPGDVVRPAGTRAETMASMIDAFDVNLTALSLLALIFGMFLIYNAVTFSVVQRRHLFGRLRAVGVTRGQIFRLVLTEAGWISLAGTTLGLALGWLLARGLLRLVARTINDLYFSVTVAGVTLEPVLLAKAIGLGVGATLLAALPAANEAASAEPRVSALRSVVESRTRRGVATAAWAGTGLGAVGWLVLALSDRSIPAAFGGLFLVISGLALVTPSAALVLLRATRPLLRAVGGTLGVVACRGVSTSLSRTAPAMAALAVAVSVTVGLGVMIQSFRGTLARWLDGTLRADVYVSLPGPVQSRASGTLPPALVAAFVAHPAVDGHSTYRGVDVVAPDGAFRLVALDLDARGERAFDFVDGDAADVMRRFRDGDGVIVSEPFAFRRGLSAGDSVGVDAPGRAAGLEVLGVFYDYGSDQGAVMMSRGLYDDLFDDPGITSLALFLTPDADSEEVVRALLSLVPEGLTVTARTNDALRTSSLAVFDRTFQVTAVLRMLAFIVAFVGVVSALLALEMERARELGVLRAWGLTPRQLGALVTTQTGLIGLVAGALSVPMGIVLSIVMIFVVNKRSFGWTLDMDLDPRVSAQAIGLAVAAGLLAGVYPAWRMSRTSPAIALRDE